MLTKCGQLIDNMEDYWMPEETKFTIGQDSKIKIPEVIFATLLAITAVSCIWLSSTLLIHLFQNL